MSGIFSGANEAALTGQKAPKINEYPGRHVLRIKELKAGISKGKKHKGKGYFAADMEFVKSNNANASTGGKVGWATIKDVSYPEYFFSDVKRYLAAASRKDATQISEEAIGKCVSEKQPAKGRLLGCYVYPTVKDGQRFMAVEYFAADESYDVGKTEPVAANQDVEQDAGSPAADVEDPLFG